jgi:hypothetical protein
VSCNCGVTVRRRRMIYSGRGSGRGDRTYFWRDRGCWRYCDRFC